MTSGQVMPMTNRRAFVTVAPGYRDLEFWYPVLRLREAGFAVDIVGEQSEETVRSVLGYPVIADGGIDAAAAQDYDVVVIPGAEGGTLATNAAVISAVANAAQNGAVVITVGSGLDVATAAGVPSRQCDNADGLPALFGELMGELGPNQIAEGGTGDGAV